MQINEEQKVKLFSDAETTGIQEVTIDTSDECGIWVVVMHTGDSLSMSLDNWNKLVSLVEVAKSQI